jgi:hypothetical protein
MKHIDQILHAVTGLLTGKPKANKDGLKQHQREAIIDSLLYCLYADDYDDPAERSVMDKSIARLNWESDLSVSEYILSASEKVKLAVSAQDTEQQFLNDISHRLEEMEARFQTIQLCKILLYSDLFFPDEEVRALARLSRVFKRPSDLYSIK